MKNLLYLLLCFSVGTLLFSCERGPVCESQSHKYSLSAEEKAVIPYAGSEKLTFVSNLGDTMHFYGQGRKSHYDYENNGSPDCDNIFEMENEVTTLKSDSAGALQIVLQKDEVNFTYFRFQIQNTIVICNSMLNALPDTDSLKLRDIMFYEVFSRGFANYTKIHYTKQQGLIYFKITADKEWVLLP